MSKIITISREFGSGGREVGKRLAEKLGYAYYDKEVIEAISKKTEIAEDYINQVLEHRIVSYYPISIATAFDAFSFDPLLEMNQSIYTAQMEVITSLAMKSDCVIVGRCADHILADYSPLRLFIYADMDSKVKRCRERATEDENFTDRELIKNIKNIDKGRANYYEQFTGNKWGDIENYDLCINTTKLDIKNIVDVIAAYVSK